MAKKTSEVDDIVEEAREAFKIASEAESENRRESLDDLRFAVEEEQWPTEIKNQRTLDGRPCLTSNLLGPFIRQVVNDSRQNRPAINVHPVDSAGDPATADVFSGLIRSIENISNADIAYDTAVEFAVSSGLGYLRIGTEYACDDTFDKDLLIQAVPNPFSIYGDPHSQSVDGSDWNSAFEVEQLPEKEFARLYKDARKVDWQSEGYGTNLDPLWCSGSGGDRKIQVANWWRREKVPRKILLLSNGEVVAEDVFKANLEDFKAIGATVEGEREVPSYKVSVVRLSGAEELEPEKEWAGRFIPIVPVYGHVINIEGKRRISSLIRSAKDAQRRYNFHLTTSTELTALAPKAPFIGPKGAFKTDRKKWETANTVTWPYIEFDVVPGMGAPPMRQGFAGVPAGEMAAAQQAYSDMKAIIGMFDASLGQRSNETSGKAIMARQREGDTATFHFIDNLSRALRQVGRILIDLIPSVYQEDRVVRVIGPDGTARAIALGQPTPLTKPDGSVQRDAEGQVLMKIFDLTAGKYDLAVTAGPSFTTRREEAAQQMIDLIQAYPAAAPLIGDLLAKNLDWPGADEIAQRLKAMLPAQAQGGPSPETVQLQQNLQSAQNELQQLKQTIVTMQNDRDLKARAVGVDEKKLEIEAYNAETNRLKALAGKDGVGLTRDDVAGVVLATINQLLNDPDLLPGPAPQQPVSPLAIHPVQPQGEPDADEGMGEPDADEGQMRGEPDGDEGRMMGSEPDADEGEPDGDERQ